LPLSGSAKALLVPPNALQFRQDGPRVAVIGEGDKIRVQQVRLGRDLGRSVEVIAGLSPKDQVVLNPHDTIEEGEVVIKREAPPEPKAGQGTASKASGESRARPGRDSKGDKA
jgi:hypothetical protein